MCVSPACAVVVVVVVVAASFLDVDSRLAAFN